MTDAAQPAAPRPRLHALFVEDELGDVDLAVLELERAGFAVAWDVVQAPQDFQARLATRAYDIILADFRLPGWNGLEALDLLRRDGRDLPFILVTGTMGDETAVECMKKGAADYVLKDKLLRLPFAVRQALQKKALEAERKQAEADLRRARDQLEERVAERTAELARVNAELRFAHDEWQRTFDCMSAAITYHDPGYNILRTNRAFREMFPEADPSLKCYQLVHGLEAPPDICPMAKALVSKKTEYCEAYEPHVGRYLSIRTDPVLDDAGNVLRVVHSLNDSSPRKRTEEEQARLVAILEASSEFVCTGDTGGRLLYMNAAGRRMVKIGEHPDLAAVNPLDLYPAGRLDDFALHALAVTLQEGSWSGEATLRARDGALVPVLAETLAHRDASGEAQFLSVVAHDITQRKEVERMQSEFVATVSHELRTPLASLQGFAELMLERDFEPQKRREFLRIIHGESRRLAKLINDFLDLQRIESGRQQLRFEAVDLAEVVRGSVALFAGERRHRFVVDIAPGLPPVRGHPDSLRQVMHNLLSNAVKYSPVGGAVRVRASAESEGAVVSVADPGIGIPGEAMPRLFSKFFRVDSAPARAISGTGLGLALVKQIVELHSGAVWAESTPGQGSTFYFRVPCAADAGETRRPANPGCVVSAGGD